MYLLIMPEDMQCMNNLEESRSNSKTLVTDNCACYLFLLGVHPYPSSSGVQSTCWTYWCGDTGGTTDTVGSIIDQAGLNLQTQNCRSSQLKPFLLLNKTLF